MEAVFVLLLNASLAFSLTLLDKSMKSNARRSLLWACWGATFVAGAAFVLTFCAIFHVQF